MLLMLPMFEIPFPIQPEKAIMAARGIQPEKAHVVARNPD